MKHLTEKLIKNETVTFRPRGNSMTPKIKSGDEVTVYPIEDKNTLKKGDIVLCKVGCNYYLHLVKSVDKSKTKCLIGNNHGRINGWTSFDNIFGIKK